MALNVGSQGKAVADLQQALADRGFDVGEVDGIFGPLTEAGVRAFQEAQGLTADGVVGPATWSALDLPGSVPKPVSFD
jgi:peptidoglycan hydrolase-like protein with peptidoglycan-binding domain